MLQYDLRKKRVWVAGHRGLVGSALVRRLAQEDCTLLTVTREELDLRCQAQVAKWVQSQNPQAVFVGAATVGGIFANHIRPAEFLYDNLAIEANVIEASRQAGVEKLLFLGSSCVYPRLASQPMTEDALLAGPLEPTNQWYAVAKIAGIMLCRAYRRQYGCDFISAMPTNLYGPGDNFDPRSSHVVPALIAKAHAVKVGGSDALVIWGTGAPLREFMYVEDLADALVFLIQHYTGEDHINVGVGDEIAIRDLANEVARVVGVEAAIQFDTSKPDGTPRKLLDSSRLHSMGWKHTISLPDGLSKTYAWFLEHLEQSEARR